MEKWNEFIKELPDDEVIIHQTRNFRIKDIAYKELLQFSSSSFSNSIEWGK